MTWLQFISSIVGSLAWPVCVVIIALVFRKRFSDLLPKLLKVNLPGGVSAEFEKGLLKVEETTTGIDSVEISLAPTNIELSAAAPATVTVTGTLDVTEEDDTMRAEGTVSDSNKNDTLPKVGPKTLNLSDLARPDTNVFDFYEASLAQPAGVVMEAWKLLEAELVTSVSRLMPNFELRTAQGSNIGKLLSVLVDKGVLSEQDETVFRDLRKLRNVAVYSTEPVSPNEARRFAALAAALGAKLNRRIDLAGE